MDHVVFSKDVQLKILGDKVSRKILVHDDLLMPVEVHFEEGGIGTIHSHPHTQITYILNGVFEFSIDGTLVIVRQGDTILFPPDVLHGAKCLEKGAVLDIFNPAREDFL